MPLRSWRCDTCGKPITDPRLGMVVWRDTNEGSYISFKIVHKNIDGRRCDPGINADYESSLEIDNFLGTDGLAELLSWISPSPLDGSRIPGVQNLDEFVTLLRRLQIPFYEEAMPYFTDETRAWLKEDGSDPHRPETLARIAARDEDRHNRQARS